MTRFQLTPAANADLADILAFVAEDSLDAAEDLKSRLVAAIDALAGMPGLGHRRDDLTDRDLRFWPVESYLIVYRPDMMPLQIVRVLSGFRDLVEMLKEP